MKPYEKFLNEIITNYGENDSYDFGRTYNIDKETFTRNNLTELDKLTLSTTFKFDEANNGFLKTILHMDDSQNVCVIGVTLKKV